MDFDKIINRRRSGCYKWDEMESDDIIPLWVADMDFEVAPCIMDALRKRVEHGVFGYTMVTDEYYDAVINWWQRRHNWTIQRDWIQYTTGVVPALSVVVKAMCKPGDKVLILTPVYNCFYSSIRNNDCEILPSALKVKELNEGNRRMFTYEIDFEDLEAKAADPRTTLLIFCNPHNPAGRVWTREEMLRVNDICLRNGVTVVSDEIHCELVTPGYTFTPFASISEEAQRNTITCNSPSKSFNTAGLHIANIICSQPEVREKIDRAININEVCDVNPFGPVSVIAAYNEGAPWIDALNEYINGNYEYLLQAFPYADKVSFARLEGTYLAWVDISQLGMSATEFTERTVKEAKVYLNAGDMYDPHDGNRYVRINLACPRALLTEAMERMQRSLL